VSFIHRIILSENGAHFTIDNTLINDILNIEFFHASFTVRLKLLFKEKQMRESAIQVRSLVICGIHVNSNGHTWPRRSPLNAFGILKEDVSDGPRTEFLVKIVSFPEHPELHGETVNLPPDAFSVLAENCDPEREVNHLQEKLAEVTLTLFARILALEEAFRLKR